MLDRPSPSPLISLPSVAKPRARSARVGWRYRANVAARAVAAIIGGYAVAAAFAAAAARLTPLPRLDAVLPATMLGCAIFVPAVLWAFLARSALRAWLGIGVVVAALLLAAWLAGPPA